MSNLSTYRDDFVLLVEAGFVAVSHLDEDAAAKLFQAAKVLDPESTAPLLGEAAIALHKLETDKSSKILEQIIEQEPDNHRAGALLGISYLLANKNVERGEELLSQAMNDSDDPATRRLGELWLEVLEKGIRKSDSPLQPKKPAAEQQKAAKGK